MADCTARSATSSKARYRRMFGVLVLGRKNVMKIVALDRTYSARPGLPGIWAEWFPALSSYAALAFRNGRPVHRRTLPITLRVRCICASSCRWRTSAGKSLRAARAHASWPCDCEHFFVSPAHGSEGSAPGDRSRDSMVHCGPSSPPILLRPVCATGVIDGTSRHTL
jgi:hypothetical protein